MPMQSNEWVVMLIVSVLGKYSFFAAKAIKSADIKHTQVERSWLADDDDDAPLPETRAGPVAYTRDEKSAGRGRYNL